MASQKWNFLYALIITLVVFNLGIFFGLKMKTGRLRVDSTNFYEGIKQLSSFFGKNLSSGQSDFYFNELKYVSKDSFDHAGRAIMKGKKPMPGNFPTIEEIQALCPKQRSDSTYNQGETEDEYYKRITVDDLFNALIILQKNGHEQFIRYCKTRNINQDDIERIEFKNKYVITPEKLAKKIQTVYNQDKIKMLLKI